MRWRDVVAFILRDPVVGYVAGGSVKGLSGVDLEGTASIFESASYSDRTRNFWNLNLPIV